MSEQGTDVLIEGRIVWGHPCKPQIKKQQDGPNKGQPVIKDGQQVQQWAFGVAVPRATFEANVWPFMSQEAMTGYPNGVPGRFSWKYKDGDRDVDDKGVPYSKREGYAGCYVLTISTELQAPAVYRLENGVYVQLAPDEIKTGDYVAVMVKFKVNVATGQNTPSLYVNPQAILRVGFGTEIVGQGAPDPQAAFGGRQFALPPGASATPLTPAGAPAMPGTMAPAAPMAAPGAMPGMMPPGAPMAAPQAAPMAPPMPAPPAPMAGPQRPLDPSHIAPNPAGGELWWNGTAWTPAPVQAAPLAPPAPDFVATAMGAPMAPPAVPGMPGAMPGMMPPR